jgi:hypothetical protein
VRAGFKSKTSAGNSAIPAQQNAVQSPTGGYFTSVLYRKIFDNLAEKQQVRCHPVAGFGFDNTIRQNE